MSAITEAVVPLSNTGRFFIHGEWTKPTSDAVIDVIDSATEQLYFQVPEAQPADMDLIIGAARRAFDRGPWPRMTHAERAGYLRAMADMLGARASDYSAIWPRGYERRGNDIGGRGMLPVRPGVRLVDPDRGAARTAR